MEICKRPTYKNISTAQGAYTRKNSNNILQQKQQKYTFTYFTTHTVTHTVTHTHTHTNMHAHSTCTHKLTCVHHVSTDTGKSTGNVGKVGGGGRWGGGGLAEEIKKFRSLVHGANGLSFDFVFELSFELGFCCSIAY